MPVLSSSRPAVSRREGRAVEGLERRLLLALTTPAFAADYQRTWVQDFTTAASLGVSASGPLGPGGGTWIAHKPDGGDWFPFGDPGTATDPFALDGTGLTINVRKNGNPNNGFGGYTGGLLSSVDGNGNGFAQQYGYFEVSMKTPGGANTWPAFWLLGRNHLVNRAIADAEVDVTESYGNADSGPGGVPAGDPDVTVSTWHQWNADGTNASDGRTVKVSGLSTGYHTYGVDIEPTGLTYYVDRQVVWTAPIFAAAKQPMYVLLDLALGGGSYNNASGTGYDWSLTPAGSALKVQYVAVWASPASPNYAPDLSAKATGRTLGTPGSFSTGDTGLYTAADGAGAAFDGDPNTFFDAPASTNGRGVWAGLDLGTAKEITSLSFAPRAGHGSRMVGGVFQASNTADFSSGVVDLYRVSTLPPDGTRTVSVSSGTAFRYVRYLSPDGGWGNIAEMSVQTLKPPATPVGVMAVATTGSQIDLSWKAVNGAAGYHIFRGTTPGGGGGKLIATDVAGPAYSDPTVSPGTTYYYTVAAVNPSGTGTASAEVAATPTGPVTAVLTGTTIGTTGSWRTGDTGLYTAADGAAAVFDGNLSTAFDAPSFTDGNGVWVGKDLGTPGLVTRITFAPRADFIDRTVGGRFQASNTRDFSSGVVDLYTITGTPSAGLQSVAVNGDGAYRYVRYLSPAKGWGNIAEITFSGITPPVTPTLTLTSGAYTATASAGVLSVTGPSGTTQYPLARITGIVLSGATLAVTGDLGTASPGLSLNVAGDSAVTFAGTQHLGPVLNNGTIAMAANGNNVLRVGGLTLGPAAKLDLADGTLIDDSPADTPASFAGLIATGKAGSAGLTSSVARARGDGLTGLLYATAAEYAAAHGGDARIGDETLGTAGVVVRYALAADADFNGAVDIFDYLKLQRGFGQPGTSAAGDFDANRAVDIFDYLLLQRLFGQTLAGLPPAPRNATPSPKTATLGGVTFADANRNAKRDPGEAAAAGKTVWLDLDDDGLLDANEPRVKSDARGAFAFKNLSAGRYRVRRVAEAGSTTTNAPAVTLAAGQVISGVALGAKTVR